ncbi:DNA-3-methyladenine glycosylase 2 family protein [Mucilaginibacter sp. Bleaf8]|uniref:DNA-3-methyladenine glycosylase family protein n=1 Tax=Mucilaginibacter sp. Bleaf8 TaxID=2834430 RepID=UPI001BD01A38|nr:DNA-3-methyladenine glycosylase 2 family protein [Mucilaginibacter sp. Bleaf8]MBS7564326.1 DNA-3-methyladenine glycosylase 2 family protein [Mucilaginibacter sp. Bleaf8]
MIATFNQSNYQTLCDELATTDSDLARVIQTFGYPPFWSRENTFESLVHIILEQQVSLASALSALNKLKERIQEITPAGLLMLSDDELKACYFSRQKSAYVRYLAEALLSGNLNLAELESLPNDEVRSRLTALKGVGNWTVDIYLLMVLHRTDVFPVGDLAIVNGMKRLKQLPAAFTKDELLVMADSWRPYRSLASMLLWHYYLSAAR